MCILPRVKEDKPEVNKTIRTWTTESHCICIAHWNIYLCSIKQLGRKRRSLNSLTARLQSNTFTIMPWIPLQFYFQKFVKCLRYSITDRSVKITLEELFKWNPVGCSCRIRRLHLCRGESPPTKCPDMTITNLMVRLQECWSFGECRVPPSLLLLPGSLQARVGSTTRIFVVLPMKQWAKWNCLTSKLRENKWLRLNWIVRNRTVGSFRCV